MVTLGTGLRRIIGFLTAVSSNIISELIVRRGVMSMAVKVGCTVTGAAVSPGNRRRSTSCCNVLQLTEVHVFRGSMAIIAGIVDLVA